MRATEETGVEETSELFEAACEELIRMGSEFYSRGWLFGTSGNLSKVLVASPLRLAITASGFDKGKLKASQILEIDENLKVLRGTHRPSSESALHVTVIGVMKAGAVFHTHSTWSTLLSELYASEGGISIKGFEMLKGLDGVKSHEHEEWIPILENSQDMNALSEELEGLLKSNPKVHGFILRGHGLYTWGMTPDDAKRHVEVMEFLLEIKGRILSHE